MGGARSHGQLPAVLGGRSPGGQVPVRSTIPSGVQVSPSHTHIHMLVSVSSWWLLLVVPPDSASDQDQDRSELLTLDQCGEVWGGLRRFEEVQ